MRLHLSIDIPDAELAALVTSGAAARIHGTISASGSVPPVPDLNAIANTPGVVRAIRGFIKARRIHTSWIAIKSGIPYQTIYRILSRKVADPHPRTMQEIIRAICPTADDVAELALMIVDRPKLPRGHGGDDLASHAV